MDFQDLLLQQIINGLSLGAMYSLLALGFTMVYGIIELINFAHFNVFMVGSFFGLWVLEATGLIGQRSTLAGLPLVGVLLLAFICTMLLSGLLGIVIERAALRSVATRCTTSTRRSMRSRLTSSGTWSVRAAASVPARGE